MRLLKISTISILLFLIFIFSPFAKTTTVEGTEINKTVYITFDDGPPRKITNKILDILKEYNVKATFFIVGKEIPTREDILKRIHNEGHTIGLHTYSHNKKKIYCSNDAFIKEMLLTQDKIQDITGFKSNIIRFPWGSNNPYRRLTPELLKQLQSKNFKIYDWNVDIKDGISPDLSPKQLLNNAKKVKYDYNGVIILMHNNSNNINTVKALPSIIEYYREQGYDFKPITEKTPQHYHLSKKR